MRKGVLELCVLSIIATHDEIYPATIREQLDSVGIEVVEGTLYPMLMRLKNMGYLTYTWQDSNAGAARKYYKITDTGRSVLDELQQSWREFVSSVDKLFVSAPAD
ncbi:MAG: PadR family transcriptional regulator [Saprospiraceae bacterium]|nr:PadR family transcriptional regulator [Saprospiraceae bacterium]